MITLSLSLALCTVMFRRFMDSFTGRIPTTIPSSATPNTTALFMFSGALYYLYKHLRKGTLVRIGQGRQRHSGRSTSRVTIQRRPKNNSWFLRNARACRNRCTDAVYRIAKQSYDSLHNLNPCVLLPNKSFHISFSKSSGDSPPPEDSRRDQGKNYCDIIFSNNAFNKSDKDDDKVDEVKILQTPLRDPDDDERPMGRRSRRSFLKRLSDEGAKVEDEASVPRFSSTQRGRKKNKKMKRVTRSGRVYSLVD
ncbi:hypothetical protein NQ318_015539 [Aromia moschata]|uniref:Uncharacterized protein n=1 Tax=Aromia moschata TaxID=1265417 RepID=A0AAV8Y6U3_9CUCU|nr:hypothetical protein NQ318_015539 [Aromia moschata]